MIDFALYRTAHGAFPESVEGEFVAFVLPPDAPLAKIAPVIQNALILRLSGALHLLHTIRVFDLLPDRRYRAGEFSLIVDGTVESVSSNRCVYCLHSGRMFGEKCESCEPALAEKYRTALTDTPPCQLSGCGGGRRLRPFFCTKTKHLSTCVLRTSRRDACAAGVTASRGTALCI